ncbi:hypothetical protein M2138_000330 [Dysgonomonadaceae bacterium PH5-43]|nr:hypothetical protein [Dysgonomonadaceae bacterium PH5-43]
MWKIEIIKDWGTIWSDNFQNKWLRVMDDSPNSHVFFHPAIVKAWVKTYMPLRKLEPLFVYGIHEKSKKEVIFPLVRWHQNWKNAYRKLIVPMGYSDFDYHDPIFSEEVGCDDVQSFYCELWKLLPYYDLIILDGLHSMFIPNNYQELSEQACPYFSIKEFDKIEDYTSTLKKSFVADLKRTTKRLIEHKGEIETISYSYNTVTDAIDELKIMLDFHSKRWPKAYKAPFFHENIIKEGLKSNVLFFVVHKVSGVSIAWYICFAYNRYMALYMPAIHSEYSVYSPGKISLLSCVEYAINNDFVVVDHLKGEEAYKRIWAKDTKMVYNVTFENKAFISKIKRSTNLFKQKLLK